MWTFLGNAKVSKLCRGPDHGEDLIIVCHWPWPSPDLGEDLIIVCDWPWPSPYLGKDLTIVLPYQGLYLTLVWILSWPIPGQGMILVVTLGRFKWRLGVDKLLIWSNIKVHKTFLNYPEQEWNYILVWRITDIWHLCIFSLLCRLLEWFLDKGCLLLDLDRNYEGSSRVSKDLDASWSILKYLKVSW